MPPLIDVKETFKVAVDNGNRVIEIEPGEHDVDDRIAEIAVNQLEVAEFVQADNPLLSLSLSLSLSQNQPSQNQ